MCVCVFVTGGCGLLFCFVLLSCAAVLFLSRLLPPGSPEIGWNDGLQLQLYNSYNRTGQDSSSSSGSGNVTHGRCSWVVASAAIALMAWQWKGIR